MSHPPFITPVQSRSAYNCPFCLAYANQLWGAAHATRGGRAGLQPITDVVFGSCTHCDRVTIWVDHKLVYPKARQAPLPNPDLPEDIKADYEEAAAIIDGSPRGAAALLRLCIQKLCKHLGESGKNINNDIASLVKKGLNPLIQKSLDIVRVIGNEAVHPGTINLKDDPETSKILCTLVNSIAEALITQPKMIEGLFSALPQDKRAQIKNRDK